MKPACTYLHPVYMLILLFPVAACNNQPVNRVPESNGVSSVSRDPNANLNIDKSPMDMSYYPVDYPQLKMRGAASQPLVARVIYSRPSVDGRRIFGDLLKYGLPWRLGANEATEIEFFQPVSIQNKNVDAGRYVMYGKPYPDHWTIVLNKDLFTWGLKIDSTKDSFQFEIPVKKLSYSIAIFTMEFKNTDEGAALMMGWDSVQASLPFFPSQTTILK